MTDSTPQKTRPKPRPEDVASPGAIIKAMYEIISGPSGKRNWYRMRSLFADGARMIPTGERINGKSGFKVMDVEEWIKEAEVYFTENDFWETEIVNKSHVFGNICQTFSTYEARDQKEGQPIARGINSVQLLYREDRWWIVTVMWDNESRENPIPEEFLPYLW